jgi:hypothetical protein
MLKDMVAYGAGILAQSYFLWSETPQRSRRENHRTYNAGAKGPARVWATAIRGEERTERLPSTPLRKRYVDIT